MFDPKVVKMLALITQVGINMLVPIFLMAWVGLWVDEKFSLSLFPLFLILGIGGGFRSVYSLIKQFSQDKPGENDHEQ